MPRQYQPKTCKTCGDTYSPTGLRQEYCPGCGGGGGRKRTNAESARRTRAARTPGALRAMENSARTRRRSYERHKDDPDFDAWIAGYTQHAKTGEQQP